MNGLNQCGSQLGGRIGTVEVTGVGQKRPLEIPESMEDLCRQVDTLREIVAKLGDRLSPVLGGGSANEAAGPKQNPPASAFAASITYNAEEIRASRRILEGLIDRLEL
jgi:hypothetical protein